MRTFVVVRMLPQPTSIEVVAGDRCEAATAVARVIALPSLEFFVSEVRSRTTSTPARVKVTRTAGRYSAVMG